MNPIIKQELFSNDYNKECFDCSAKNPEWVSVNNAVFLCKECQIKHRSFGLSVSYIRSIELDIWKEEQISILKLGGNKRLIDLLQIYNVSKNIKLTDLYFSKLLDYHRKLIKSEIKNEEKPKAPSEEEALEPFDGVKRNNENVINVNKQNSPEDRLLKENISEKQENKEDENSYWNSFGYVGNYVGSAYNKGKDMVHKIKESEMAQNLKENTNYAYNQIKEKGEVALETVKEKGGVVLDKSKEIANKGYEYSMNKYNQGVIVYI